MADDVTKRMLLDYLLEMHIDLSRKITDIGTKFAGLDGEIGGAMSRLENTLDQGFYETRQHCRALKKLTIQLRRLTQMNLTRL